LIFIVARMRVRPEFVETWLSTVEEFTVATRAEPGNLWFDWSRSVDSDNEFVLIEAFRDGDAGVAHVQSDHFQRVLEVMRPTLLETPRIINVEVPAQDWSRMGELEIV
jgi:quinol monooxygenase YgiN